MHVCCCCCHRRCSCSCSRQHCRHATLALRQLVCAPPTAGVLLWASPGLVLLLLLLLNLEG